MPARQREVPEGPAEPRKSARKDYFAEKQKKLFSQFHLEYTPSSCSRYNPQHLPLFNTTSLLTARCRQDDGEEAKPAVFDNVVVWVNGYTEVPASLVLIIRRVLWSLVHTAFFCVLITLPLPITRVNVCVCVG
jgi:hypothetical protein